MDFVPLPTKITDRNKGQKYMRKKNEIVIWDGKRFLCEHSVRRERCKECGGSSICEHSNLRIQCKECEGSQVCEHGKRKDRCKKCEGNQFCQHGRLKDICKECGGSQICEHGRRKDRCKECGGSSICKHGKERRLCRECEGTGICEHKIRRNICKTCNLTGHLTKLMRGRVWGAMKHYSTRKDKKHTYEYIGCSVEYLRSHLETQFEKESERCGHSISWENQGDWHIDHIKPCDSFDLDLEDERHKCFHYTNLQPMWAPDNLSKSNIYDEYEDEREWNGDKWI
jgi:hypothetical protein